jgi:hypothetical protein
MERAGSEDEESDTASEEMILVSEEEKNDVAEDNLSEALSNKQIS